MGPLPMIPGRPTESQQCLHRVHWDGVEELPGARARHGPWVRRGTGAGHLFSDLVKITFFLF